MKIKNSLREIEILEKDAIEFYEEELKINGNKTLPYSKEAVEFAVLYPLIYAEAYQIWMVFGTERASNILKKAHELGMLPCISLRKLMELDNGK